MVLCYLSSPGFKSSFAATSSTFANMILTASASVRNVKYMELMCRGVTGRRQMETRAGKLEIS